MTLIDYCRFHTIDEIMQLEDVQERVTLYFEQQQLFREQLERVQKIIGNVVIMDLRNEDVIYTGNRFLIYALYPEAEISVHVVWGFKKQNTAVMIRKSIINKNPKSISGISA